MTDVNRVTNLNVRLAIAAFAGGVALLLVYYFCVVVSRGELGQKEAWSVLQRVEVSYRRDIPANVPILLKNAVGSDYTVLGLPSLSRQYPRVWFILNDQSAANAVKQLPRDIQFAITCSYLTNIRQRVLITESVLGYLQSHCSSKKIEQYAPRPPHP